jgi:hypothetical protein
MVAKLVAQMNGNLLPIFRGVLIILIGASAIGIWNFNADIASLSTFVKLNATAQTTFNDKIDHRVEELEHFWMTERRYD